MYLYVRFFSYICLEGVNYGSAERHVINLQGNLSPARAIIYIVSVLKVFLFFSLLHFYLYVLRIQIPGVFCPNVDFEV